MRTIRWALATLVCFPFLWLRCRRRQVSTPGPVLVIQLGKLGDVLCTTAMLRALSQDPGVTEVHVLCLERCIAALLGNPSVARVYAIDGHTRWALLKELRAQRYRAVINCLPGSFASMVGLWVGAPARINTSSQYHGLIVRVLAVINSVNIPYQIRTSTHAHYMALVAALGVAPVPYGIDFTVPSVATETVAQGMRMERLSPKRFVVVAPTAGNAIKQWPLEKFSALCDVLVTEHDLSVVLLTQDQTAVDAIRSVASVPTRIVGATQLSLAEIGALCAQAAAFVSVDTGPMYIAHAVGCPLVILLGPIHPAEQVPPPGPHVAHVAPPPGCVPWVFVSRTPRAGTAEELRCIRETPLASVVEALRRVLSQSAPSAA